MENRLRIKEPWDYILLNALEGKLPYTGKPKKMRAETWDRIKNKPAPIPRSYVCDIIQEENISQMLNAEEYGYFRRLLIGIFKNGLQLPLNGNTFSIIRNSYLIDGDSEKTKELLKKLFDWNILAWADGGGKGIFITCPYIKEAYEKSLANLRARQGGGSATNEPQETETAENKTEFEEEFPF